MKLRDQLLDALRDLPGTRRFHVHVLLSSPRKYTALYPYATARPRVYAQDLLVLCSEEPLADGGGGGAARVLVSAIEAAVFAVPATRTAVLYVAKVDSTGQGAAGAAAGAPTAALVRALLAHYLDPATRPVRAARVWVHVFARAQAQYLFPNSAEHPRKRVLGDVQLCAWWARLFARVARELGDARGPLRLYYVLPGMGEVEAAQALGGAVAAAAAEGGARWVYGHPYAQTEVPLPYAVRTKDGAPNLGQVIPSFDDDPKTRFMDEIACTTQVDGLVSPKRKRRRTSGTADGEHDAHAEREKEREKDARVRVHGELGTVSADEFWERMSFRQECTAGAVTGFFVAACAWPSAPAPAPAAGSAEGEGGAPRPQPGEVSHQLVQRVVRSLMTGHDFSTSERTERATESLEGAIKGLCAAAAVPDAAPAPTSAPALPQTPPPPPPHKRALPSEPEAELEAEPDAPDAPTRDTYEEFIYGTVAVTNAERAPDPSAAATATAVGGAVTVLAARKKKR
ncbi:histone acetylation protein-domain-containing protein [Phellopilus nigrolimitatus]|nr:histone acetylation protein-domain-containing protein [Phellopilus nigrolimitatus]